MPAPETITLFCPQCDYDLTGLTCDRCPECGNSFDREQLLARLSAMPAPIRPAAIVPYLLWPPLVALGLLIMLDMGRLEPLWVGVLITMTILAWVNAWELHARIHVSLANQRGRSPYSKGYTPRRVIIVGILFAFQILVALLGMLSVLHIK